MKDIVEDALQHTGEKELDESLDDDLFLPPTCGLIGCGPAGIDRVDLLNDADRTVAIGKLSTLDGKTGDTAGGHKFRWSTVTGPASMTVLRRISNRRLPRLSMIWISPS